MRVDIEELKKIIVWAKEQKIRRLKMTDSEIEVVFSNAAIFTNSANLPEKLDSSGISRGEITENADSPASSREEDDPDLYWSAE